MLGQKCFSMQVAIKVVTVHDSLTGPHSGHADQLPRHSQPSFSQAHRRMDSWRHWPRTLGSSRFHTSIPGEPSLLDLVLLEEQARSLARPPDNAGREPVKSEKERTLSRFNSLEPSCMAA